MQKLRRFDGCKNSITSRSTQQLKKNAVLYPLRLFRFIQISSISFFFLLNRGTYTSKRLESSRVLNKQNVEDPHICHYISFMNPKFEGRGGGG